MRLGEKTLFFKNKAVREILFEEMSIIKELRDNEAMSHVLWKGLGELKSHSPDTPGKGDCDILVLEYNTLQTKAYA